MKRRREEGGWEAERAWASLSYLGPNADHEPTIEITVNQCETLATAGCLVILHDYAVRRGVARRR